MKVREVKILQEKKFNASNGCFMGFEKQGHLNTINVQGVEAKTTASYLAKTTVEDIFF